MVVNFKMISLVLFCLLLNVVRVQNYSTCATSESCIPLDKCPLLTRILESSNRSLNDISHLRSKQCGYTYPNILVCCELSPMSRSASDSLGIGFKPTVSVPNSASKGRGRILPSSPECGTVFANRVVGGRSTSIYEFPWMALLEYTRANNVKEFGCGGSLINNRYVLSAAHCVLVAGKLLTGVRLGEWNKNMDPDCEVNFRGQRNCAKLHPIDVAIEETIVHKNYDEFSVSPRYDIALLRMASEVEYTDLVSPICLPKPELQNEFFDRFKMDVAGWGYTNEKKISSDVKLKAELEVWNLINCRRTYAVFNISLIDSQMCAGGELGIDACGGDSGGPLMTIIDNVQILAGIVSYGPTACGTPGLPGVFTRVAAFRDWMVQRMKP